MARTGQLETWKRVAEEWRQRAEKAERELADLRRATQADQSDRAEDETPDRDDQRFLIVAGNHREAENYRREHNLGFRHVRFAGPKALRGLTLNDTWTIVYVGTWRARKDLVQLAEAINYCTMCCSTEPRRVYTDA